MSESFNEDIDNLSNLQRRTLACTIWQDKSFIRLSDDAKLVFIHAFSSPYSNQIGCYESTPAGLSAQLRWEYNRYVKAFNELIDEKMIDYDADAHVVFVQKYFKYNRPYSSNVVQFLGKTFDSVPSSPLKLKAYQSLYKLMTAKQYESYKKKFDDYVLPSMIALRKELNLPDDILDESKPEMLSDNYSASEALTEDGENKNDIQIEKEDNYSFEDAWAIYPERKGVNMKNNGLKAWNEAISQGVSVDTLMAATKKYAIYCDKNEISGTKFVLMASSFFGSSEKYMYDWEIDSPSGTQDESMESLKQRMKNELSEAGTLEERPLFGRLNLNNNSEKNKSLKRQVDRSNSNIIDVDFETIPEESQTTKDETTKLLFSEASYGLFNNEMFDQTETKRTINA